MSQVSHVDFGNIPKGTVKRFADVHQEFIDQASPKSSAPAFSPKKTHENSSNSHGESLLPSSCRGDALSSIPAGREVNDLIEEVLRQVQSKSKDSAIIVRDKRNEITRTFRYHEEIERKYFEALLMLKQLEDESDKLRNQVKLLLKDQHKKNHYLDDLKSLNTDLFKMLAFALNQSKELKLENKKLIVDGEFSANKIPPELVEFFLGRLRGSGERNDVDVKITYLPTGASKQRDNKSSQASPMLDDGIFSLEEAGPKRSTEREELSTDHSRYLFENCFFPVVVLPVFTSVLVYVLNRSPN